MKFRTAIDIDATPATVWRTLTDVESWPKWTASMTSVERLQKGELGQGSTARVTQPKLKPTVYTVTEYDAGKSFVWEMKATGVKVSAVHVVEAVGEGHARMTLGIEQTGALSGLISLLLGKRTRQYVQMEAEGLKKAAETAKSGTE
ncbi:SRPBCC family protein [Catenulispora pinisilvae]|uniref:SRPBCC family protein n=1 Tax=Catenulispora pinisilvae TaxID=2705253 RepID=UPI001891B78A|nr:SRPBCC family protein [Catenulispora pinisilvae]